jgi:alcohol dehydrogenase
MKALVYHGPGKKSWDDKPEPALLHPTDALVRITTTTICGTDLHILKGDVPEVPAGLTLGHEGVGTIVSVGSAVSQFQVGNRVLISCITSCGKCAACRRGMYSHCADGGWQLQLGHLIDGTQAELVRVPHADGSLHHLPAGCQDEESLTLLSDIFPTGFECGVLNGEVKPGDTVAIVGAGPIGLSALLTARFYSPAEIILIDPDRNRLEVAAVLGATRTWVFAEAKEQIMQLTQGLGVDVAIEAVGIPETFELCTEIVAAGGHIANIGVHGRSATLHLERLWAHNITLRTRLVDTVTTPQLLKAVTAGTLQPARLITHRFPLGEIERAYETFSHATRDRALKVILTN